MALSTTALTLAQDATLRGPLQGATHFGSAGSRGDGPYFQLWLIVESGKITRATYQTHGCPSSMAVGGVLCTLFTNRELARARALNRDDVAGVVGSLPEGKEFNYDLAAEAIKNLKETNDALP